MSRSNHQSRGGLARHIQLRPASRNGRVRVNARLKNTVKVFDVLPARPAKPVPMRLGARIGERFGRFTVLEYVGSLPPATQLFKFKCDCGQVKTVDLKRVKTGQIKSCGCDVREKVSAKKAEHLSPFIAQHGTYHIVENRRTTLTAEQTVNRYSSVMDGWLWEDRDLWEPHHITAIVRCRVLWRHPIFSRGFRWLKCVSKSVPRWKWDIFENVIRWNEPTGVPGSRLSTPSLASVRAAKAIVRDVAEDISVWDHDL